MPSNEASLDRERVIIEAAALLMALLFAFASIGTIWEHIPTMIQVYGTALCFLIAIVGPAVPTFSPELFPVRPRLWRAFHRMELAFFLLGLSSLSMIFFSATQQFTSTALYWQLILLLGFAVAAIFTLGERHRQ
jgi:hypothetical protein